MSSDDMLLRDEWSGYAACDDLATHLWLIPERHSGSVARAEVIDLDQAA
jgi:hypothetical protein